MKSMLASRSFRVVTLTLVAVILVVGLCAFNLFERYSRYQAEIDRMVPRMERFNGLISSEAQVGLALVAASEQVNRVILDRGLSDVSASAEVQRLVRDMIQDTGASVAGSQALPPKVDGSFTKIQVAVNASLSVDQLDRFLRSLDNHTPAIFIDSLTLQPQRQRRGDLRQVLSARMVFFALARRES